MRTTCFNMQYIDILLTQCMSRNSENEQGSFVNRLGFTTENQCFGRGRKLNIIMYYSRELWPINARSSVITVLRDTIKCRFVDVSCSGEPVPSLFKVSSGTRQDFSETSKLQGVTSRQTVRASHRATCHVPA